jgi:FAD/FMN-containing dehydrogenase
MTIDNVLAAEVVTADGQIRQVDADHHPDLFWAIRGGGGNLGVVTKLQLRLVEVDEVYAGWLVLRRRRRRSPGSSLRRRRPRRS